MPKRGGGGPIQRRMGGVEGAVKLLVTYAAQQSTDNFLGGTWKGPGVVAEGKKEGKERQGGKETKKGTEGSTRGWGREVGRTKE